MALESLDPKKWFEHADKDVWRATRSLELEDFEYAGVHLQQAIEKYLKGFLLSNGWKLRKIHNLEILLNDVILFDASLEEFRSACIRISEYYIEERYPMFLDSPLTEQDIREGLEWAGKIRDRVKVGFAND